MLLLPAIFGFHHANLFSTDLIARAGAPAAGRPIALGEDEWGDQPEAPNRFEAQTGAGTNAAAWASAGDAPHPASAFTFTFEPSLQPDDEAARDESASDQSEASERSPQSTSGQPDEAAPPESPESGEPEPSQSDERDESDDPGAAADDPLTPAERADFELWKSGITESTNAAARRTAATKMLQSGWSESIAYLAATLESSENFDAVISIAEAVAGEPAPPEGLLEPLLAAFLRTSSERREAIVMAITNYPAARAAPLIVRVIHHDEFLLEARVASIDLLSRFVEVSTVDSLIECLDESMPSAVRQAARDALESVTGVTHIQDSRLRWRDWWDRHRDEGREGLLDTTVRRLRDELSEARRREREAESQQRALMRSLLRWIERTYALTPRDQRSNLIVSLLDEPRAEVRSLGLRLVEQAMTNGEAIGAEVGEAVAKRVDDSEPAIQAEALERLRFINADRASELAAGKLSGSEDHPSVRLAALSVLSGRSNPRAVPLLINRFVSTPGRADLPAPEREATAEAILAACRQGMIADHEAARSIADVIRNAVPAEAPPAELARALSSSEVELLAWAPVFDSSASASNASENGEVNTDAEGNANEGARESGDKNDNPDTNANAPTNAVSIPARLLAMNLAELAPDIRDAIREQRQAAARGLAASGANDAALFDAAGDPEIHPIAFDALLERHSRIEALRRVLDGFNVPDEQTLATDIERIMSDLPITDWLEADDRLADARAADVDDRARWLRRVLDRPRSTLNGGGNGSGSGSGTGNRSSNGNGRDHGGPSNPGPGESAREGEAAGADADAMIREGLLRRSICIRLADLELQRGAPEAGLAALQAAPVAEHDQQQFEHLRAVALLAAAQFDAIPESARERQEWWFEALDVVDRMPADNEAQQNMRDERRLAIATRASERFGEALSESRRRRLASILETVGAKPRDAGNEKTDSRQASPEDGNGSLVPPTERESSGGG